MVENVRGGQSLDFAGLGLARAIARPNPYLEFVGADVVTYSFASADENTYRNTFSGGSDTTSEWSTAERAYAHDVFAHIETFADVDFVEVSDPNAANILLQKVGEVPGGWGGYASYPNTQQSILVLREALLKETTNLLIHEIGHALGLDHPFDGEVLLPGVFNSDSAGDYGLNNELFTTMAYNRASVPWNPAIWFTGPKDTAAPLDIAALQFIYGANTTYRAGDDVYTFEPGRIALWDTGGWDVIDARDMDRPVLVDLAPATLAAEPGGGGWPSHPEEIDRGDWEEVDSVMTIAYGTQIEGVEGSEFADRLVGNAANNKILGHGGDDSISGADGDDTVIGGAGNDTLNGGIGIDILDGGPGWDTARYAGVDDFGLIMLVRPDGIHISGPQYDGPSEYLTDIETVLVDDRSFTLEDFAGAASLSEAALADIAKLYIAYFDRAPAAEGLLYWGTRLADGMSLPQIAQSFYVQPEAQALYGDASDSGALVDTVFDNVLGRAPAPDGQNYWTGELNTGSVREATFILAVINGAEAATGSAADAAYLADKADIGLYFGAIKGLTTREQADDIMALYDGTETGLRAARDAIDTLHADEVQSTLTMPLVGVIDDPFGGLA